MPKIVVVDSKCNTALFNQPYHSRKESQNQTTPENIRARIIRCVLRVLVSPGDVVSLFFSVHVQFDDVDNNNNLQPYP